MRTKAVIFFGLAVLVAAPLTILAGVYSGEVKEVRADSGKITIVSPQGKVRTFDVPAQARVQLRSEKISLKDAQVGQKVVVYTSPSGMVYRVTLRGGTPPAKPTVTPTVKPTTPKVTPKPEVNTRPATTTSDADWFQFRGPKRDNISAETGLSKNWQQQPPKPLWAAKGLGEGYSAVVIADGKVFTLGTQGNNETLFAINLSNGNIAWSARNGGLFREGTGNGPRGTPAVSDGKVYALGANGDLGCYDARTGRVVWQKNILQEFNGNNITWGISESPLIDGDKVVVTPGGRNGTMVALNKNTGRLIWKAMVPGNHNAGYSSPVIAEIDGVKQYITFTSRAVIGVRAEDGEFLWSETSSANGTANCSTPLVYEDYVFSASGYGTGGALLKLTSSGNKTTARQMYHTRNMKNHHGGMVILDGHLYGSDDPGVLTCIELKTGDVKWKNRSVGKGSLSYADGHLYLRSERGPIALVEATPAGYQEKGRIDQPQRSSRPSWAHPVIADGKLFLRDQDVLLVYDLKSGRRR